MSRVRIDSGLVNHLMWQPGQEVVINPLPRIITKTTTSFTQNPFSINEMLNGQLFYETELPDSLEKALGHAGENGIVLTLPEILAAKVKADKTHEYWKNWICVHTEENIGIDKLGLFYGRGDPVLITVHGGGILTPQRIRQAYDDGLNSGSAKYSEEEFNSLLEGRVATSSEIISMFKYEDIKQGINNLPHRFGIVTPYDMVKDLENTYFKRDRFIINPLAITRAAGTNLLGSYHDLAKDNDGDLGCYHPFNGRDPTEAQGRLLFVNNTSGGLSGISDLNYYGRLVGVAPKVPGSPTK